MSIGIYKIENTINHKIYIGQSKNIEKRIYSHKNDLKNHHQHNALMQKDFNKYGIQCFCFSILELCSLKELDDKEKFYIKKYQSHINGYNYTIGGKCTKETKLIEKSKRTSSYNLHKAHLIKLALYMDMDRKEISKLFNVSINVIYNVYHYKWFFEIDKKFNYYIVHRNEILQKKKCVKMRKMFENGCYITDILKKYHATYMPKLQKIDYINRENKLMFITNLIKHYSNILNNKYQLKDVAKILNVNYKILLKILNHNFIISPKYCNYNIKSLIGK